MNTNTSSENENELGYKMGKKSDSEEDGVTRFPCSRRQRHTPTPQQQFDGRKGITNDDFGLTVHQFEKYFKASLERRKQNSQWILNLRYPVKSSNEYLEYLENCIDYDEGYVIRSENDSQEKDLFEQLVKIVGRENDIRHRQRLFLIHDVLFNIIHHGLDFGYTYISSGSLSEGLNLPGSDFDLMYTVDDVQVINNEEKINYLNECVTLLMEIDPVYPGFSRLKLVGDFRNPHPELITMIKKNNKGSYIAPYKFVKNFQRLQLTPLSLHGPCISDTVSNVDFALVFHNKSLPCNARQWVYRQRKQWPPAVVIDTIIKSGCMLVPIGPKTMTIDTLLWRISFSVAEKLLVHSFNYTQLLCYSLLKLTLKQNINEQPGIKDLLCSYFLKTALFWVSEEVSIETFHLANIFHCFMLCMVKLRSWIENCYCPNYFIPKQNMFQGRVNMSNNQILLRVVDGVIYDGIIGLTYVLSKHLTSTRETVSSIQSDFLFYKIFDNFGTPNSTEDCIRGLTIITSLLQSESSEYVRDVCRRWISKINQYIPQQLPSLVTGKNVENTYIRRFYHSHLQDAIKQDAVTGWLLYASYYYVIGQYNVTLRIVDYVLSKCTQHKIYTGISLDDQKMINDYSEHFQSKYLKLSDRIKLVTISSVKYLQHSSLIPDELKLEIQNGNISVPPVVVCHCLNFLSFYHIGAQCNKQRALWNLYLTVTKQYFIFSNQLSISFTILGVCYELSGDVSAAVKCYNTALLCQDDICMSAEIRKTNLLKKTG